MRTQLLLDRGCDATAVNHNGLSALHIAAAWGLKVRETLGAARAVLMLISRAW